MFCSKDGFIFAFCISTLYLLFKVCLLHVSDNNATVLWLRLFYIWQMIKVIGIVSYLFDLIKFYKYVRKAHEPETLTRT